MRLGYMGFLFLLLSANAFSESSGVTFKAYAKAAAVSVSDPDGDVGSASVVSPGIEMIMEKGRDGRLVFGFSAVSLGVDASENEINQDISGYSLYTGYQKRMSFTRDFKVWFGAALAYSNYEFSDRYSIDGDGFLLDSFEDRSVSSPSLTLSADKYFNLSESYALGFGVFADMSSGDSLNMYGLKISIGNRN